MRIYHRGRSGGRKVAGQLVGVKLPHVQLRVQRRVCTIVSEAPAHTRQAHTLAKRNSWTTGCRKHGRGSGTSSRRAGPSTGCCASARATENRVKKTGQARAYRGPISYRDIIRFKDRCGWYIESHLEFLSVTLYLKKKPSTLSLTEWEFESRNSSSSYYRAQRNIPSTIFLQ